MTEKKKVKTAVGVFAGYLNADTTDPDIFGKLLLTRRVDEDSIIPDPSDPSKKVSFKGNWELPGGGVMETNEAKVSYSYSVKELEREVKEELGFEATDLRWHIVDPMPPMYPVFSKGPEGYDLAMVTPMETLGIFGSKAEIIWVSPKELNEQAKIFVPANKKQGKLGKGLLSGWGKRMHCMALKALCSSSNQQYAQQAKESLMVLQSAW